jgi:hypothetical protein
MLKNGTEADLDLFSAEDAELLRLAGVNPATLGEDEVEILDDESDDDVAEDGLGKVHRKRRKGRKARARRRGRRLSKSTKAKLRRLARLRPRTKKGRFSKGAGRKHHRRGRRSRKHAMAGMSGDTMMDLVALSSIDGGMGDAEDGLGKVHRKRRKGAKAHSRKRRHGRKGGMRGLNGLVNLGEGIGQAEMTATAPVIGVFQWAATRPGLEAIGGVALAPIVSAIVMKIATKINLPMTSPIGRIGVSLVSAIAIWELGKAIKSPSVGKFGALYVLGRMIETEVTAPYIMPKVGLAGLGTLRVPDTQSIGQVLFPNIHRGDYAVNPLSGLGTVRIPDQSELVGLGQERVPDTASIGAQIVTDEELLGEGFGADEAAEEDSDVF